MEAARLLESEDFPLAFLRPRHTMRISKEDDESGLHATPWRHLERMKTVSVALVVCLNVGVDPPDVSKTSPCAQLEAWVDPSLLNPTRALHLIGSSLQKQYERWQPRARYRQSLDPTVEEVRRLSTALRKSAREERVLFHYNGHGVPKPTANGEIWVFNRNFTQYIPLSLYDLQAWMGSPSIFVYDCSNAGIIAVAFEQFARQHEKEYMETVNSQGINSSTLPAPPGSSRNCIQLAACSSNELLPMNPELPADLFTSCLTTPVKIVLRWFILQNKGKITPSVTLDMLDKIPGLFNDRRTMLGELNWIFTAITDTIAWNTLSRDLFQKLFREDLLVASLFRNFLLAERIMRSYDCTPVSSPKLPPTHQHPLWQAWDLAVDMSLSQLPGIIQHNKPYVSSSFFEEQLTAFQVWLKYGRDNRRKPPEQLPIVLQVLLSQDHRLRALDLLSRFLDLGPWAVNLALCVGIFPYVLRLLQSCARELRPLLVSIWTKILAVDSSCQSDLVRENCHNYFLLVLKDPIMMPEHRTGAAFVLASMVYNYESGQKQAERGNLISICLEQLDDPEPVLRQWLAIALGRVWDNFATAKWRGVRDNAHERLYELLKDDVPEVRTAAVFALGTFIHATVKYSSDSLAESLDHKIALYLLNAVAEDASPMVRMELVVALQWIVYAFEANFIHLIKNEKNTSADINRRMSPPVNNNNNNSPAQTPSMSRVASRIISSASSPSLDRLSQTSTPSKSFITSSTPSPISNYGGVYSKIYSGLVRLSTDPFHGVSSMALELLNYLKSREVERESLYNRRESTSSQNNNNTSTSSVNNPSNPGTTNSPRGGPSAASTGSINNESSISFQSSSPGTTITTTTSSITSGGIVPANNNPVDGPVSLPPGTGVTSSSTSSVRKVKRRSSGEGADSLSGVGGGGTPSSGSNTLPRNNNRQHHPATPSSLQPLDLLSTASPSPNSSLHQPIPPPLVERPDLSTEFVEWSSTYFSNELMKSEPESSPPDTESSYHWEVDWLNKRNESLRFKAAEQTQRLNYGINKIEEQLSSLRFPPQAHPSSLQFHPFNNLLVVGLKGSISVHNVGQHGKDSSSSSINLQIPGSLQISALEFINSHEKALLVGGSDDGSIRIWRDWDGSNREAPSLVTAWYAMPDLWRGGGSKGFNYPGRHFGSASRSLNPKRQQQQHRGMKLSWEPQNRRLLSGGGGSRAIRLWDVEKEMKVHEWMGTSSDVYLTQLSITEATPMVYAAGFSDGSIRMMDIRRSSPVQVYREQMSILDLKLRGGDTYGQSVPGSLVAGYSNGLIHFYEPRALSSSKTIDISSCANSGGIGGNSNNKQASSVRVSALCIHERSQVVASWSEASNAVSIHSLLPESSGPPINTIRHYEGLLGQRMLNIKSLVLHPHLLTLAVHAKGPGASSESLISSFGLRDSS